MTNRVLKLSLATLVLSCLMVSPSFAVGPIDGEVGAIYWANNVDSSGGPSALSSDAGAPGFRAELWLFKKYGIRAGQYRSELEGSGNADSDSTSIDFMWRAFSPTESNFFAVGAGWQQMDLATLGLSGDTSGVRLSAEGRVSLGGLFYAYGQGSYLPSLDDTPAANALEGSFEKMTAQELELGVAWKTAPFLSLRAGYRMQSVDYTQTNLDPGLGLGPQVDGQLDTDGFLMGMSVRF